LVLSSGLDVGMDEDIHLVAVREKMLAYAGVI
jgi:hypothetical protein